MPALANPKHEKFAEALAKGETAGRAYVLAGYKRNDGNAARLKGNEKVSARVAEIIGRAAGKAEITQERVMRELGRIGFSDIRKLFSPGGDLLPIHELDDDAAAALSAVEVVTRRSPGDDEVEVEHVAKIKLWDKRGALGDLAKIMGMMKDAPDMHMSVTFVVERTRGKVIEQ